MGNKYIKHIIFFALFFALLLFIFRDLATNISTHLPDWRDYGYVVWIINQNINHLKALDFANIFNTNAFFPHSNTVFLSETFFTPSLMGLPLSLLTKNPITLFNLIFFLTLILNYASSYLFWKKITKADFIAFIGAVGTVFSPFFYTQFGHFQMFIFWPLMFSLYFLVGSKDDKKKLFLTGLFLAIQFLASVYLAYFLAVVIFLYLFIDFLKDKNIKKTLIALFVIFSTFLVIDGIFIKGYTDTQKKFDVKRVYGEYVAYSAHLTDYMFPQQQSLLYQNSIVQKWKSFNKHTVGEVASFPGFVLTITALLSIFSIKSTKSDFSILFKKGKDQYWFFSLIVIGFLFSLGARISFNGAYSGIPNIYALILKIPFIEAIRGLARWSFLLYFGLTYFSLMYLKTIRSKLLLIILSIIFLLELVPYKTLTYSDTYITQHDEALRNICSVQKTVVLEVPITHFDVNGTIAEGLSYITRRELATLYNQCYLVNGYSGYDLPDLLLLKEQFYIALDRNDPKHFVDFLKSHEVNILNVNANHLTEEAAKNYNEIYPKIIRSRGIREIEKNLILIEQ